VTSDEIVRRLMEKGLVLATAESCTGGMVAAAITDVAGSSAVFDRGFVTYSNAAKASMLGVPMALIEQYGAVSKHVAEAMAKGARANSQAHIAIAITGIAGPSGGSAEKPVGLVHFALATNETVFHREERYGDLGRAKVRKAALHDALQLIAACL
jgi:nicotinamide-nucleotide amidase